MSISTHMNIYIYMHAQIHIGINIVYRVHFAIWMHHPNSLKHLIVASVNWVIIGWGNCLLDSDAIMDGMASQITGVSIGYSIVCSGTDQRKYQSSCVTGLCERNLPVTGEVPAQRPSYAENVSIWWRHHVWPVRHRSMNPPMMCLLLIGDLGRNFAKEHAFENVVCEMVAILLRPHCVNH